MRFIWVMVISCGFTGSALAAESMVIKKRDAFLEWVTDKELSRPMVKLRVGVDGTITGSGAFRAIVGSWEWKSGYFCRDLKWGSREIGYNCQQVSIVGDKLRFTSDRGNGESADFSVK